MDYSPERGGPLIWELLTVILCVLTFLSHNVESFNSPLTFVGLQRPSTSILRSQRPQLTIPQKRRVAYFGTFTVILCGPTLLSLNVLNQKLFNSFFYLQRALIFNFRPKCLQITMLPASKIFWRARYHGKMFP